MKKLRKFILVLFLLPTCSLVLLGQVKLLTQASSSSEIDELHRFYKNKETLNLITTHGEIGAAVTLEVNNDGKPKSIIIEGVTKNKLAMASHLANTINMKVEQGYEPVKSYISYGDSYFSYLENYTNALSILHDRPKYEMAFSKEEMNFHLVFGLDVDHLTKREALELTMSNNKDVEYFWRIELKDTRRATGLDGSEFVF